MLRKNVFLIPTGLRFWNVQLFDTNLSLYKYKKNISICYPIVYLHCYVKPCNVEFGKYPLRGAIKLTILFLRSGHTVTAVKRINNWSREAFAFGKARMVSLANKAKENKGQALVEYALILALIAVVVIVALSFLGGTVNNTIHSIGTNVAT